MIIAELFAGLGNQLFQYAAARALSEKLQVPLKLNLQSFQNSEIYQFELEPFNITSEIASESEIKKAVNLPENIFIKTALKISERLKPFKLKRVIIREKSFQFENELKTASENSYLFGHWQSEKYFIGYENLIRKEFSLKAGHLDNRLDLIVPIQNKNSVSIILRRGDYLKYPDLNLYGEDLAYFYRAIEFINSKINKPHYFIFSDDIDWVKENLKLNNPHTFVSQTYPGENYKLNPYRHQDLILISHCKHHIITNSTFAWWGAWLSPNSDKIVISPTDWFAKGKIWYDGEPANTKDIVPKDWIKI